MAEFSHIKVNVICKNKADNDFLIYRIYVDNDMLTERTFGWPAYKIYIRENLICLLEPGLHQLKVVNTSGAGVFDLTDFSLNGDVNCSKFAALDESQTGKIISFSVT